MTAEVADGSKVFHLLGSHGYMSVCCVLCLCVCVCCVCVVFVCVLLYLYFTVVMSLLTCSHCSTIIIETKPSEDANAPSNIYILVSEDAPPQQL